jgi:hypothetical protein
MKKIIFLFILTLIGFGSCIGQTTYQLKTVELYTATPGMEIQKVSFIYDGIKILTQLREFQQNSIWVNYDKNTYVYDPNGDTLSELKEYWQNNRWIPEYKYTYTYDADRNKLAKLEEIWQNGTWINNTKFSYTYNINGNPLIELYQLWQGDKWINGKKGSYTYDVNENMLTELFQLWQNDAWVNETRDSYTYDVNGNKLTGLYELWQNNSWINDTKFSYTYDVNENMLTELFQLWQNDAWVNDLKFSHVYDSDGNGILTDTYFWSNNVWANSTTNYYNVIYYNKMNSNFSSFCYRMEASYQMLSNIIIKPTVSQATNLMNYPNPFSTFTTISYQITEKSRVSLDIFDINGKEIAILVNQVQETGKYEINFTPVNLTGGLYYYRLIVENLTETKKMILAR